MSKIRFGIIGCGVIQDWHAQVLKNLSDIAELVAVCDIVPEKAKNAAEKFGARSYTDLNEMVACEDIDAITIATPSGLHAEHALAAIANGKHVLVEKPIDISLEKADRLIKAAHDAGVVLTSVSQNRYGKGILKLHEWLDEGKLGRLVYGEASIIWYRSQEYYDSGDWRGTWALDGGGSLMNQGVHYADQLRWVMGKPKVISAHMATLAHKIEVEDIVTASITFENGAIGTLTATTSAYPGFSTSLEIYGTEGTVMIKDNNIVRAVFTNGETYDAGVVENTGAGAADPTAIAYDLHTMQFVDFIDCINNKRTPWITGEDGRAALQLVLGVYESAKTGKPVTFP